MKTSITHSIYMVLLVIMTTHLYGQGRRDKEEWIQLFNGKDLHDWKFKISGYDLNVNYGNTFRVEDGLLKVSYDQYDEFDQRFGHLFFKNEFSYYRIRVKYRFIGEQCPGGPDWAFRNSGIMIHGQTVESMTKEQDFPISIEVQLLGGDRSGDRPTANLCTPGTNVVMNGELMEQHCVNSTSKTFHGDKWVTVEVIALGDSLITHLVNGDEVLSYSKPQIGGGVVSNYNDWAKKDGMLLEGGTISLQSESHPVEFKEVELLNLKGCMDPSAKNYKSYYVKEDNESCIYD